MSKIVQLAVFSRFKTAKKFSRYHYRKFLANENAHTALQFTLLKGCRILDAISEIFRFLLAEFAKNEKPVAI